MARDYENLHDREELDDRELRDLVREQLAQHTGLDIDDISVTVREGLITLSGRVGTEGERRVADHVVTDVLGIVEFNNELLVDPVRRATSPDAIDEHLADEAERSGTLLGDMPEPYVDEAQHLHGDQHDDVVSTTDYEAAMREGLTWVPPDGPTPEGLSGTDATPPDYGEHH